MSNKTDEHGKDVREAAGRDLARDPWHNRHRLRDAVSRFVIGCIVFSLTVAIAPGISADHWLAVPTVVLVTALLSWALRPIFIRLGIMFGWFGAAALAIFGNFVIMYIAIQVTPGLDAGYWFEIFLASWIYSIIMTIIQWLLAADSDDVFMVSVLRQTTRAGVWGSMLTDEDKAAQGAGGHPQTGAVFVQLDGMPAPVLDWAVKSGNLPTLSRWIRSGDYSWSEWRSCIPSTTPVAQAGLLHGRNENMPAFRWYEKDTGKLLVANRPADAAIIEARISDGTGLLADKGVSISNLFSGDAESRLLVMSGMSKIREGLGPSKSYASFFTHPSGFTRALILTVGEMIKEKWQARAQAKRNVVPRISRKGSYVALRGITNVMLRDLNTALVVEAMMKGAKSIYVDFVDYDEIAHHAGVQRPESLRALEGLDKVLSQLEAVVRYAPRPYQFVCVSDHGQSQGSTFRQRFSMGLEDVIRSLMGGDPDMVAATSAVEDWGPLNTFLSQLQQQDSVTGGLTKRAMKNRSAEGNVELGPSGQEQAALEKAEDEDGPPELVVVGSGNWGGIWFGQEPGRLTYTDLQQKFPGLVQGLADHPGISFVVVQTESKGPVALSIDGAMLLETGEVRGNDPIAIFGEHTREDLLRVAKFTNAPDIYVNSMYDQLTDEVAAFEELVGCHGGVGGWQTRAILVHPTHWPISPDRTDNRGRLIGAVSVHEQMVEWLEALGHRRDLRKDAPEEPAGNETKTADPMRG